MRATLAASFLFLAEATACAGQTPDWSACPTPAMTVKPLHGGQAAIALTSSCRGGQQFIVNYAGAALVKKLDAAGKLEFTLDCFAGDKPPVEILFTDGARLQGRIEALDLDRLTKLAIIWRGRVNLDLHAYEYAAAPGAPGHIWEGAPGSALSAASAAAAEGRGRGFMSALSDGEEPGDHLEVYTFWHARDQKSGVIATSLDYESRNGDEQNPESCGGGLYDEIEYEVIVQERNKSVSRSKASYAAAECGVKAQAGNRYISKAAPDIFIR